VALVAGLAVGSVAATGMQAQAALNPFERGPAPSTFSVEALQGPFAVSTIDATNIWGAFGSGKIYYPTDTSQGKFGVVAIGPGFLSNWAALSWMGPRIASQGFVVIGIDTNSVVDLPSSRGDQELAALQNVVKDSRLSNVVDPTRLAVAGWSMGGGGALDAAVKSSSLKAAIPMAPWEVSNTYAFDRVPTLVLGGQSDIVAPVSSMGGAFYDSITAKKAYLEFANADHFFPTNASNTQARMMISWLKRWVDNDTRYDQFICPGPPAWFDVHVYKATCPMGF
jgi:dienelactone hydrolase